MTANKSPKYSRVLLKLSGEALAAKAAAASARSRAGHGGTNPRSRELDVQVVVVVGGGNIFRGLSGSMRGIERATGDYMGCSPRSSMRWRCRTPRKNRRAHRVQSAITMSQVAEAFIRRRAVRHLEKGRVVIFGGGTGNPYFSTDTAAALRANEIGAEVILKATKVDGIYDCDPKTNPRRNGSLKSPTSKRCKNSSSDGLHGVFTLHGQQNAIIVFDMFKPHNLRRVVMGEKWNPRDR